MNKFTFSGKVYNVKALANNNYLVGININSKQIDGTYLSKWINAYIRSNEEIIEREEYELNGFLALRYKKVKENDKWIDSNEVELYFSVREHTLLSNNNKRKSKQNEEETPF